jgi:glycosyltransferase involved in cell wall biosynthesis
MFFTISPKRVLYCVNHSYPFSSDGYAVRTHSTAVALVQAGFEVITISQLDILKTQNFWCRTDSQQTILLDGVRYININSRSLDGLSSSINLQQSYEAISELVKVYKPAVVMAASNWHNAMPAALVASDFSLPFFYDVRGFWELSHVARDQAWSQSADFHQEVSAEISVTKMAQRIFTINSYMRDELVKRGVSANQIDLVPNGFVGWPGRPEHNSNISDTLIQKARQWVGYIGSFGQYEGLDDLLNVVADLRRQGMDVGLLLVGSSQSSGFDIEGVTLCPMSQFLKERAEQLDMADALVLPGRLGPAQAAAYYTAVDIVVIPRRPVAVTELVSPIKPIEAASHGKRVLMSDVTPLAELAGLYPNFFYFQKGSVESLKVRLRELLLDLPPELPRYPGLECRTWTNCVRPMVDAFKKVSDKNKTPK